MISGVMRPVPSDTIATQPRHTMQDIKHFMSRRTGVDQAPIQHLPPPEVPVLKAQTPDFVLYIHPNCKTSNTIRQRLQNKPLDNVFIKNILLLQTRPKWLNGVPILADAKLGLIYKGSDCLVFLDKLWNKKQTPILPPPLPEFEDNNDDVSMTPIEPSENEKTTNMSQLFELPADKSISGPKTPSTISDKKSNKFDEDSLSKLIAMRAQQLPVSDNQQLK